VAGIARNRTRLLRFTDRWSPAADRRQEFSL